MAFYRFKYRKTVYKSSKVRNYFEYQILPFFSSENRFQHILIVGIANFTQHYPLLFQQKKFVRTIDTNPSVARFSSAKIHIIDSIENIEKHIDHDSLDLVLMNGVYGWGLDSENALKKSLNNIHMVMKQEGVLVFGWNEMDKYDPLNIRSENYFGLFQQYLFKGESEIKLPISRNPKHGVVSFFKK